MDWGSGGATPGDSGLPSNRSSSRDVLATSNAARPARRFRTVAVGRAFTIAVTAKGAAVAWGDNSVGSLGDGHGLTQRGPVAVALPEGVTVNSVSASWGSVFALASDGWVYGWGDNSFGQLGDGTTCASSAPRPLTLPPAITSVDAGYWHGLALTVTGEAFAWGDNSAGQLGNGTTDAAEAPVAVTVPCDERLTQVSGGGVHSLALSADGRVWAWGDNSHGQLGDGTTLSSPTPVAVRLPEGTCIVEIAAMANASLALANDGRVYAWGDNTFGQLGDGTTITRQTPVRAYFPQGVSIRHLSAGSVHAVALDAAGELHIWGRSQAAHPGVNTAVSRSVPVQMVVPTGTRFAEVSAGFAHSAAITTDGRLLSCGADWAGQLAGEVLPGRARMTPASAGAVVRLGSRTAEVAAAEREAQPGRWVYVESPLEASAG